MSKKKPRSKDPHSWIKDTKKKGEEPAPAGGADAPSEAPTPSESAAPVESATPSEPAAPAEATAETAAGQEEEEETAEDEGAAPRLVVVEYDKNDGRILATHELLGEPPGAAGEIESSTPEGKAAIIPLTGKMRDKTLLDIHQNHRVDTSKAKPTLAPKG